MLMSAEQKDESLIDDDIIDIFLEEADDVLETLNTQFPAWRAAPDDVDTRLEVRRAFHTLKGSGRMVQAECISELAWAVENMLNKITDGAIPVNEPVFALVERVRQQLPALLDAFRHQTVPADDGTALQAEADALARGETAAADRTPAPETVPASGGDGAGEAAVQAMRERLDRLSEQCEQLQQHVADLSRQVAAAPAGVSSDELTAMGAVVAQNREGLDQTRAHLKRVTTQQTQTLQTIQADIARHITGREDAAETVRRDLQREMRAELQSLRSRVDTAGRAAGTVAGIAVLAALIVGSGVVGFHLL